MWPSSAWPRLLCSSSAEESLTETDEFESAVGSNTRCIPQSTFISFLTTDHLMDPHSRRKSLIESRRHRNCQLLGSPSGWMHNNLMTTSSSAGTPLEFRTPWISGDDCHITEPVLISSVIPHPSSIAKPLERQLKQPPQTYQRSSHALCHLIHRTTCMHPQLEQGVSSPEVQSVTGQWHSMTYDLGELSTGVLTHHAGINDLPANVQNRLCPPASLTMHLESSNGSSISLETVNSPGPITDLSVYVVSDPLNTVSNLTVPILPVSPPGFKYHLSVDTNSLTVKLRLEGEDYVNTQPCARPKKICSEASRSKEAVLIMYDLRALSVGLVGSGRCSAQALQVAAQLIRHARDCKMPEDRDLWCPDCGRLPMLPVTGQCGHTRCSRCIQDRRACPCGVPAPQNLHINTLIQDLINKMLPDKRDYRGTGLVSGDTAVNGLRSSVRLSQGRRAAGAGSRRGAARRWPASSCSADVSASTSMAPQTLVTRARRLAAAGHLRDAALHLARAAAAASAAPLARLARLLLAQTITAAGGDPRRVARGLFQGVRAHCARERLGARLGAPDLECALCYHVYTRPVTTPCGHTYCRTCIERSMDYRKLCALCQRPLDHFDLAKTRDTVFVTAALAAIDALAPPPPPEPDVIPIFVCTVAFPAIPCPLFIFDPRYWMMIRRVLESGSRQFGMVAYDKDRSYSDYGTVLEVRDCVHLEDGRSILSTVGVSRFRVIQRDVRDGCDVARTQPLTDMPPTEELVRCELRLLASQVWNRAHAWVGRMGEGARAQIEAAFGPLPALDRAPHWWAAPDGPAWLWWLVAILPLRTQIKILILSTRSLRKRIMAVSRTLEALDHVTASATATVAAAAASECELRSALTNADQWLGRAA